MKKCILVSLGVAALFVVGFFAFNAFIYNKKQADFSADHLNIAYDIDGVKIKLTNGLAETEVVPDSASRVTTRYFGNDFVTDLNNDGRMDIVFFLTQEMGGSGTYFYVVAALNGENGYIGSQALLVGDRIAPQTIEAGPSEQIIVNYADRAFDEPMTAPPSVGKSLRLILDVASMQFGEVVTDFEGEADPDRMTLEMKTWMWQRAEYNDGRTITPIRPDTFSLTFSNDGSVAVGTDCNSAGGDYSVEENRLSITNLRITRMYCEGSQETEFITLLENTSSFHFTSRGELILDLHYDSGSMTLR